MTQLSLQMGKVRHLIELAQLRPKERHNGNGSPASTRCPHCGSIGVFGDMEAGSLFNHTVEMGQHGPYDVMLWLGVRHCPNGDCRGPVFMVEQNGEALITFPASTIDFDASNLPQPIRDSLEEAIKCHAAGCFRAAALLVRRTLEEVCADKGAEGRDLHARIAALRDKITLPGALFDAMTSLRLLGNDAAHIEAKTYDDVGRDEVEAAVALAKEIVKAAYQYEALLAQLKGLERGARSPEGERMA